MGKILRIFLITLVIFLILVAFGIVIKNYRQKANVDDSQKGLILVGDNTDSQGTIENDNNGDTSTSTGTSSGGSGGGSSGGSTTKADSPKNESPKNGEEPEVVNNTNTNQSSFNLTSGDYEFKLNIDNRERTYYVHVPSTYDVNSKTPMIFNFHGGGGSANGAMDMTRMKSHSDQNGYIVVFPEGTREDGDDTKHIVQFWNFEHDLNGGSFKPGTAVASSNDVKFVEQMINSLGTKFNIDEKRIYSTGISNGAIFSHYLACKIPNKIASIAAISGSLQYDDCNPSKAISVIQFHGTEDIYAPYEGGKATCKLSNFTSRGAVESTELWAVKNNCNLNPQTTYQNGEVTCKTYSSCTNGNEVTLCTIQTGGHTWPGGNPYFVPFCQPGKVTQDINANNAMWDFFIKHSIG